MPGAFSVRISADEVAVSSSDKEESNAFANIISISPVEVPFMGFNIEVTVASKPPPNVIVIS
ncbi:MAG: hypothetical protein ACJA0N_002264 [Pseudohongiellaceae bacterium]|jgi:hypothetical protein